MNNTKAATWYWLALLLLTASSVASAYCGLPKTVFVFSVLLIALIKGEIIIDRYMGLRYVAGPWRAIVFGWLFIVIGGISLSFL
ncbi:cytochrome C oxidase subunit IV family protein [Undibacterium sp. SXout7W]|uniref:cytochrome C oxidase subunit IV family protein n=1 Tax=Undibacterium sp. SXout7W TaxID=3413049 RepID=UPI003BF40718